MCNYNFEKLIKKYAQLIIQKGVNIQKNQTLVIQISVEQLDLARSLTKEAYIAGAGNVIVQWHDDTIQKEFLLHANENCITTIPPHKTEQMNEWINEKASRISVVSSSPDTLIGVPTNRITAFQNAMGQAFAPLRKMTQSNQVSWIVVAAAGEDWAKKVFPTLPSTEEQITALWKEIFKTTRIFTENPVQAWQEHEKKLTKKADELNQKQFQSLHYTAPGTDLTVGLPDNHLWEGAGSKDRQGNSFIANMPTEEVFTAPDFRNVNGYVTSTKPLSYAGTIISGMKFTFKNGEIIDFSAEQGEEILKNLLATDSGARRLGEVALVPDPSPISQSGIIFYNTLFDENASNHLALGSAYAFNLKNGTHLTEQELAEAGLNRSNVHVDFMIGSAQMNIDGMTKEGEIVPIFRKGDWV